MNATWYAFLGLSAIIGALVAILMFAILRFGAAARDARKNFGQDRMESALLSSALEEAIGKLKAQQRATTARAEASERLSEEIVASLTSGLLVVDRNSRVQIVNPAADRILSLKGLSAGADYREALGEAGALADVIAESLRTNAPILRRTVAIDIASSQLGLDGATRPTHLGVSVSPLTADGAPSGAICLFTDLTDVVALEEQLRLKDSLARLGELTAGLAHEFRNGLATIHGYGRLLDPKQLPEQYGAYVEGIRSETQALGEIVTNFLNFARPEPLTLTPVDLGSLVARAAEDAPSASVTLRGEFATIEGDEVLLRQAFSNLFRNSVEAVAPAGTPHIVVEGRVDHAAQTALVSVRDDGPGIPPAALGQVFQPFFTTRAGGTGLGLAIVQKVVVSHNGRISAGNHPEGGALFLLSFPLRASDVATIS
jgi:two-component system sensor histidine kinase HydH